MNKNFSEYFRRISIDEYVRRFSCSGFLDLEVFMRIFTFFSIFIFKSFMFISNDIDIHKISLINFFKFTKRVINSFLEFLKRFKEYQDKKYQNLKNLYNLFFDFIKIFKNFRDLLVLIYLMCYVLKETEAKSLSYTFSARELADLGVSTNTKYKLDARLISKIGVEVNLLEIFNEIISLFNFSIFDVETRMGIEKTSCLNYESQFKVSINTLFNKVSDTYSELEIIFLQDFTPSFNGQISIDINSDELITPQLIFDSIDELDLRYEYINLKNKELIKKCYG